MKDLSIEHYHIENKNIIDAMAMYNVYVVVQFLLWNNFFLNWDKIV